MCNHLQLSSKEILPRLNEVLVELLSSPIPNYTIGDLGILNTILPDILAFREVLEFNEREILIRPFSNTSKYLQYEILQEVSHIYFKRYGLQKLFYTQKVKIFGLTLIRYLSKYRLETWIRDLARYEMLVFSQLWVNEENFIDIHIYSYSQVERYVYRKDICKIAKFSFNIKAYIESSTSPQSPLNQERKASYLVFIGNTREPHVSIQEINEPIYSLLRFCFTLRSDLELKEFLNKKGLNVNEIFYKKLINKLIQWNILKKIS
jgi:hypothetical protein